jgi:CRP-like cAMP-binding protein
VGAGGRVIERGRPLDRLVVVFSGRLSVEADGQRKAALRAGHFAGEMSFVTGEVPSADVRVIEPARLFVWKSDDLTRFLEGQNEFRLAFQSSIGADLVGKLRATSEPIAERSRTLV